MNSLKHRVLHAGTALALFFAIGLAHAQSLPVSVTAARDTAAVRIGDTTTPLADLTLNFDQASGLSASSLGVSANLVRFKDLLLLTRLPSNLTSIPAELPMLITVEPPGTGGLSFQRTVNVEIHTHALAYTAGSRLRVFKAPLGGQFRDITNELAPGSVRARGTTGGFSQFIILLDTRRTSDVIAEKFAWLRNQTAPLPSAERSALDAYLDVARDAVAHADYVSAIATIDLFRERVAQRAGVGAIPQTWRATHDTTNSAGELLAGAATLRFSVAFLRDFGQ